MITIGIPNDNTNERKYIINIIISQFLGLEYELIVSPLDWVITLENGKKLIFQDHFFSKYSNDLEYLNIENIPSVVNYLKNQFILEEDLPVIYGSDEISVTNDYIICGIDIFAASFFMITRWEEYVNKTQDEHNRFPATASLAHRNNFLDRPIVNEYIEMCWNMLVHLGINQKRKENVFKMKLTHDVDEPFEFLFKSPYKLIRTIVGDTLKRKNPLLAVSNAFNWISIKTGNYQKDRAYTFKKIMDLGEKYEVKDDFYFIPNNSHDLDGNYNLKNPRILELVKLIYKRGHNIGYHGSYTSFQDMNRTKAEVKILKDVVNTLGIEQKNWGGRQHFLRWDPLTTWRSYEAAGLDYDTSLSYVDHAGFRCGICLPYNVYNIEERKKLKLLEYPLIVMECSVLDERYMNLSVKEAKKYILKLKNKCKKYNGVFTLLWHNTRFMILEEAELYEQILKY